MAQEFDLIVIGTGTAASTVAVACREKGWNVAVIDCRPFGGTCSQRGCDPKKVLVGAAETVDRAKRLHDLEIGGDGISIDWSRLIAFKRTFTEEVPENTEKKFADAGIAMVHGTACFTGRNTLEAEGKELTAKHIVIASGARPATLNIPGEEHLTTSAEFMELETLPKRIVFVGGGYISMEFAHVAVRSGARVTVLHRGERPLDGFEPYLTEMVAEASRDAGIDLHLKTDVEEIHRSENGLIVHASTDGTSKKIEADIVVHGAGRVPELDALNLEAADVKREKGGVSVNEYLQSVSNPSIYAAGDCAATGGLPLTPTASAEGACVADNLLHGNQKSIDYTGTPTVAYTIPPIASVGLTEEKAREQGIKIRVNREETSGWFTSRRLNEKHSGFSVIIDEERNRVVGAHLFGPNAEDVINIFALAIRADIPLEVLKNLMYAYPTASSDISYMVAD